MTEVEHPTLDGKLTHHILELADEATGGGQTHCYGDKLENHQNIADLWNAYLFGKREGITLHLMPSDVAIMMCLLKIARMKSNETQEDTFVDTAAYAAIAGELRVWENQDRSVASQFGEPTQ